MIKKIFHTIFRVTFTIAIMCSLFTGPYAAALSTQEEFGANDITYLTNDEPCSNSTGLNPDNVNININADLPADTVKYLESLDVKGKVQKNIARYVYAQTKTGIPWQALAAMHYREAMLDPSRSIADGEVLANKKSVDGVQMYSDPNLDAESQANHLINNAKGVYGVDLKKSTLSADDWGKAFLAYNRGAMYKNWNKSWQESPYVVNGFDSSHMNMKWIDADSYVRPGGKRLNGVSGKTDGNKAGALTVFKYLGGLKDPGGSTGGAGTSQTTPSTSTTPSVESTNAGDIDEAFATVNDCSMEGGVTAVGDLVFPLAGNKSVITSPGMFKNGTTDRGSHPYIAYDLMSWNGARVIAFMSGTVTRISTDRCGTTMVSAYNKENDLTISYLHMNASITVKKGDTIVPGSPIGTLGKGPCSTQAHLHIDAARGQKRPGCSRLNCPKANQAYFVDIGPQLYQVWQAVPTGPPVKGAQ